MASAVRLFDNFGFGVGSQAYSTSTVMYNIIKQNGPSCLNPALNGDNLPADTSGIGFCSTAGGSNPYSPFGTRISNPAQILETYWYNGQQVPDPIGNPTGYGFYAPMFDTPANVVNGSSLPNSSGISPINLFPWLEKLFVGDTVGGPATINNTFATHFPSLWDYRPGDDAFDTTLPYLNPITGTLVTSDPRLCLAPVTASAFATTVTTANANRTLNNLSPPVSGLPIEVGMTVTGPGLPVAPAVLATVTAFSATNNTVTLSIGVVTPGSAGTTPGGLAPGGYTFSASDTATCPMIPFGTRGGASTDPNDGSLWLYGAFAKNRLSSVIGPGQWGTSVANYSLDFPAIDPYGNDNTYFADVPTGKHASSPGFRSPRTWRLPPVPAPAPARLGQGNPPILPPPSRHDAAAPGSSALRCPTLDPIRS